ncbi:hypothetical protein RchiOBHm_Chr7g0200871 [Rosa chinensis]|uniref:Uncharacterized protein n=1 Tax=Rosa chinensis TaxID=74649 RepID=A0A2P6P7S3_ROSCH|nr:hypothetical protein RchiOBHm_Chr7g0200871 [Rosa chinensis]
MFLTTLQKESRPEIEFFTSKSSSPFSAILAGFWKNSGHLDCFRFGEKNMSSIGYRRMLFT